MQTRQISNLRMLSEGEIICLATALMENSYSLTTERPLNHAFPTGVHAHLLKDDTFKYLLDDQYAYFNTYSIQINIDSYNLLVIPVGIYGVSPQHEIRMPIIIGDFITNYIKINEFIISEIVGEKVDNLLGPFEEIKRSKENLIRNIFGFYRDLKNYNSIMVWEIRDKSSFTRTCATREKFQRSVSEELNREFYHSHDMSEITFDHLVNSAKRLISIVNNPVENLIREDESSLDVLSLFCKTLISK